MGPVLKVAHRGVPWADFADAPALPTPPGSTGIEFDTPGAKAPNLVLSTRACPREAAAEAWLRREAADVAPLTSPPWIGQKLISVFLSLIDTPRKGFLIRKTFSRTWPGHGGSVFKTRFAKTFTEPLIEALSRICTHLGTSSSFCGSATVSPPATQ